MIGDDDSFTFSFDEESISEINKRNIECIIQILNHQLNTTSNERVCEHEHFILVKMQLRQM